MAGVLETLTVPRTTAFPAATLAPIRTSSLPSPSFSRRSVKIQATHMTSSSRGIASRRLGRRGSRIVCEARDTAVEVAPVTDSTWQSLVLESPSPVLVEFWAPWCGPCRMIHPVIDELAKQYTGKLKCYKVNTDESPSIATKYGIRSIPTVIIFKDGEKKDAVIGAVPKSTLTTSIEKFL